MLDLPGKLTTNLASTDIDDQSMLLNGWEQNYTQLEAGPFKARLLGVKVAEDLNVFRKVTNRKLNKYFVCPGKKLRLATMLPGSDPAIFQKQKILTGDVFVIKPGIELELVSHGKFDVGVIEIEQNLSVLSESELNKDNTIVRDVLPKDLSQDFANKLFYAFNQDNVSEPAIYAISAPAVKALCTGGQPNVQSNVEDVVDKAIRFVDNCLLDAFEPPKIPEVALHAGVSERGLEYAFARKYGVSPRRYFIFKRLHEARRDIRDNRLNVTNAAMKWGFTHLGRFSGLYRDMFGELPSHTVAIK